jgi:putative lipoprotein
MDVASTVIATFTQSLTGAPPYKFALDYSAADIDARMQYSLRAKIMLDGALLFTSTERLDPFKHPEDAIVIKLSMVGSNKAQEQAAPLHDADTGLAVVSVNPLAELANTYWKLISLNETDVTMAEEQTREAFLQLRDDNKSVKGFAGCNAFTGSYSVNGNDLSVGPLAATRKACPAGMNTETEFLQVLEEAAYYSIHEEASCRCWRRRPTTRFTRKRLLYSTNEKSLSPNSSRCTLTNVSNCEIRPRGTFNALLTSSETNCLRCCYQPYWLRIP